MKKAIYLILLAFMLEGCSYSSSECAYTSIRMQAFINNRMIDEKQISGCFISNERNDSLTEIAFQDSSHKFSMHYMEGKPDSLKVNIFIISQLDVNVNGSTSAWNKEKGHTIYSQLGESSLAFSFGEDPEKDNRVSGLLVFYK